MSRWLTQTKASSTDDTLPNHLLNRAQGQWQKVGGCSSFSNSCSCPSSRPVNSRNLVVSLTLLHQISHSHTNILISHTSVVASYQPTIQPGASMGSYCLWFYLKCFQAKAKMQQKCLSSHLDSYSKSCLSCSVFIGESKHKSTNCC